MRCPVCGELVDLFGADEGTQSMAPDRQRMVEVLARVIENRHGTLLGIGTTLREAFEEIDRGR